jgi:4-diphosphocytidyl-2-C-methyl-D-erythritol kinase
MAELDLHDLLKLEYSDLSKKSDEVIVEINSNGGEFSSLIDDIPADKNLISIAVKNYMKSIGFGGHFVFSLTKNIPSGAGLGGGSSNAAAALKIVSETLHRGVDDYLFEAASAAGSDIPFFLKGGFAFAEGRGEFLYNLDYNDKSFVLLVNNGIHVNTGLAYKSLNKPVSDLIIDCEEKRKVIKNSVYDKYQWETHFFNDFEPVVFELYPQISKVKEKMYDNGAFFSAMSGSGSTVFGLFESRETAENVKKNLETEGNRVYLTKFRS